MNQPGNGAARAFPTFAFGQSGIKHYMNVVTLKHAKFTTLFMPPASSPAPSDVAAFMAAAHAFARSQGMTAGLPTFNQLAQGHEVIAFPPTSGVVVNSSPQIIPGVPPASGGWVVESLPVLNDGGLAITNHGTNPIIFNVFNGELAQFRHSPQGSDVVQVDPFVDGSHRSQNAIQSQVSCAFSMDTVHVIWADFALFHGSRPIGLPDSFTFDTASGSENPPMGIVGFFNHLAVAPDGSLHALAYLSAPTSVPGGQSAPDDAVGWNLLHLAFNNGQWSSETVDGEGFTAQGHVEGNTGQGSCLAFEPDGTMHAFYQLVLPSEDNATVTTSRLRHAQHGPAGWLAQTLDGSRRFRPASCHGYGTHPCGRRGAAQRRVLRRRALGRLRGPHERQPAVRSGRTNCRRRPGLGLPRRRRRRVEGQYTRRGPVRKGVDLGHDAVDLLRRPHQRCAAACLAPRWRQSLALRGNRR